MDNELYQNVVEFVAVFTSCKVENISPQTRLFQDLGIDGDDAEELLTLFAHEFSVNLSSLDFCRHFGPELPGFPSKTIFRLFKPADKLNSQGTALRMIPITVSDLYEAASSKRFPDLNMRAPE